MTVVADVWEPYGGVIEASDGALYGTSRTGGAANCGYVYRLEPQAGGTFVRTILHEFAGGPSDGCQPYGELAEGPDGALYGTTRIGGPNVDAFFAIQGTGTIYKIAKTGGPPALVRPFAARNGQGVYPEGNAPIAGLTLDPDGNLYGTASIGGTGSNAPAPGTIFRFTPAGVLEVLYNFGVFPATDKSPLDALTLIDGNLYGTMTASGASNQAGVLFRVTPTGVVSPAFTFPSNGCFGPECYPLGKNPWAAPTQADGAIYVLAHDFGPPPGGYGSVVRVDAGGAGTLVHAFSGGTDGGNPHRALALGSDGLLYGLTTAVNQTGPTVFRVATDGSSFQTLHEFVAGGGGLQGRLLEISPGQFIGTSASGGTGGRGFVYRMTVEMPNQSPVASAGSATTVEDTPVSGQVSATDADGDPLTFSIVSNGGFGSAVLTDATTGAFTYTPSPNAAGTDTFTFAASDGTSTSDPATVTVTIDAINDAPTALPTTFSALEDTPFATTLQASDAESDPLAYSIVSNGSKGTASITNASTGAFTYTPNGNANGGDSFTFQVTEAGSGGLTSNVATFTVNIAAVNDAPSALTGVVTTSEGSPVSGTLQAMDIDGGSVSFSLVSQPGQGTVSITDAATGAFTYTPNAGGMGYDTFTFEVSDGSATSTATEMVFIVANSPRWPGQTVRASVASDGTQGNRESFQPVLSADGRYVAFYSWSSNLVAGDANGAADVFVHDRQTGETRRVSVASVGTQGNGDSHQPSLSADGRYVAFRSDASNLVAGDTNGTADAFVHDRQTGETRRVSVASDGGEGNSVSYQPSLSADGRYVAFHSVASNLVAGDTNGTADVFVHDRQTGETQRVSIASDGTQGNDYSYEPSLSADGRHVVFSSFASNLVAGDTNFRADVFLHDRQTAETRRVSVASDATQANGDSYQPSLSADGRYLAFISVASNLVAGDTNFTPDVFAHDRQTGETRRVSVASDGTQQNADSYQTSLSADGRYVAFRSVASNLVAGDTNGTYDVFVHDGQTGETRRVSVASDGTQGNGNSYEPSLSADGRYAAFTSYATNFAADDTNGYVDVFVVGAASLPTVPAATDDAITTLEDAPASGVLNASDPDGAPLTFAIVSSGALGTATLTNAATGAYTYTPNPDANGTDTFTFQASNGSATSNVATVTVTITPVNDAPVALTGVVTTSEGSAVSGMLQATDIDGGSLSFSIASQPTQGTVTIADAATGAFTYTPIVGGIGYDTFTFAATDGSATSMATELVFIVANSPRWPGNTVRVSISSEGTQGDDNSYATRLSADGRFAVFTSRASNLVASDPGSPDVFVHDRQTQQTTRVSVASDGTGGNSESDDRAAISADGRFIAFASQASNLVADDTNGTYDVFVHDRQTAQTTRVSVASAGTQANSSSRSPSISGDGRFVAFSSFASNLVADDTNGQLDIFVHDRQTAKTTRVSVATDGTQANAQALSPALSADGRFVVFSSAASTLVPGDTGAIGDVFVHDRDMGETTRVSVSSAGMAGNSHSEIAEISADGRFIVFYSQASNLVPGDTNGFRDVFVHDRLTGQTTRESVATAGTQGNSYSWNATISANGRFVAFSSRASNLVGGDTNDAEDGFVRDRETGQTIRVSVAFDGYPYSTTPAISADGRFIGFDSVQAVVADDTNSVFDVFVVAPLAAGAPGAQDSAINLEEDTPASGALAAIDPDGDPLTFSIVSNGTLGLAVLTDASTGAFRYTPNADASGADSFRFKVSDGTADSNEATVSVTIAPINDAPIAEDVSLTAEEDTAASGSFSATDVDGPSLRFVVVGSPSKGTVTVLKGAAFTYTPNPNASGTDSFTFKANDGALDSNIATVTVTINGQGDAPIASNGTLATSEDSPASGTLTAVDPDGDALSYVLTTTGTKGRATMTNPSTGAYVYTPLRNATGADTFTFAASDGSGQSNVATVSVTIAPVNDQPVAHGRALFVLEDASKSIALAGSDADNDALTYEIVSGPTYGTLTGTAPNLVYEPAANYNGADSFTFRVFDARSYSGAATISLDVVPTLWESTGPEGGRVDALVVDPANPNVFYAGSAGGIFKSTDAGTRWAAHNYGLTNFRVHVVAIDPTLPGVLYAGTDSGLFKSTDGGVTWQSSGAISVVTVLAVDPFTAGTVYAGGSNFGMFKTTDGGRTWTNINVGLPSRFVRVIAVDPETPGTVYLTTNMGVFKSTNAGESWFAINAGLSDLATFGLAIDRSTPTRLFVSAGTRIFKSADGGLNWSSASEGLPPSGGIVEIAISQSSPSVIYAATNAGVFRSANGGVSWTATGAAGAGPSNPIALAVHPLSDLVLAGTASTGVFRSTDGTSWTAANAGLAVSSILSVGVGPGESTTLLAAAEALGVQKSLDAGTSWATSSSGLPGSFPGPYIRALAVAALVPSTAFAAPNQGLYKSSDAGATWTSAGLNAVQIFSIAMTPDAQTICVGGSGGVQRSIDGGATWSVPSSGLPGGIVFALAIDSATPSTIYAGTNVGLFKSIDGGNTWTSSSNGITTPAIRALVVDPANPSIVYAGTIGDVRGVYKTVDGGASWVRVASFDQVMALAIDISSSTLYAGTNQRGVFRSLDGGLTWQQLNTELGNEDAPAGLTNLQVNALTIDNDQTLYAATGGGGVFRLFTTANDAPTAANGSLTTNEDKAAVGMLSGTDAEGNPLTYAIATNGTKGVATITNVATGAYIYTPNANANGTDTFTFKVNDGTLDSNIATVTVAIAAVNDAPVAQNGSNAVFTGSSVSGTLVAIDVDSPSLTYTIVGNGAKGIAVVTDASTGAYTYTANAGASGTDTFTFRANDGSLDSNIATITVTIATNRPPLATDSSLTTQEDKPETGTLSATDPDGNRLTFSIVSNGSKGTATITNASAGRFSYAPAANAFGSDTFTFKTSDGNADSNTGTVTVTITAVNDAPVAVAASATTAVNAPLNGTLVATDVDGDTLTYSIAKAPRRGTITSFNPATGAFTYTPRAGFAGTDSFTFKASDGTVSSATATVSITIN